MDGRPGGGGDELRRFRRLADLTAVATFLLIILGGVVRVSESGLGCGPGGSGTEGWPLCGGDVIPLVGDLNRIIEFSHRLLAGVVAVMIGLLVWRAIRLRREASLDKRPPQTPRPGLPPQTPRPNRPPQTPRPMQWPLRGAVAAGVLVLVQAALGGLTVEKGLAEELVAAHLGLAMLLLGLVLWLDVRARAEGRATEAPISGLKPFAAVAGVLLLGAIVAGGYMAGTEEEGVSEARPNVAGAHLACGEQFPGCLGRGALPFGESRLSDIHLTHRVLVYGASVAILLLIGMAYRRGSRDWTLAVTGFLLLIQLLLGALNVWLGEHAVLVVGHLTAATLLWSSVLLVAYRLAWAPAIAAAGQRAPQTHPSATKTADGSTTVAA